jgi:hypothetical protein
MGGYAVLDFLFFDRVLMGTLNGINPSQTEVVVHSPTECTNKQRRHHKTDCASVVEIAPINALTASNELPNSLAFPSNEPLATMSTSFQFVDLDMLGIKGCGGDNPPHPPSIVSLSSDIYSTFASDLEQYVPTSMADLFEGALCDDGTNGGFTFSN